MSKRLISINGVDLMLNNVLNAKVRKSYLYVKNPWILEVQYRQQHEEVNIVGPFVRMDRENVRKYKFKFDDINMAEHYKRRVTSETQ